MHPRTHMLFVQDSTLQPGGSAADQKCVAKCISYLQLVQQDDLLGTLTKECIT